MEKPETFYNSQIQKDVSSIFKLVMTLKQNAQEYDLASSFTLAG